jgi:aconitate hydratase
VLTVTQMLRARGVVGKFVEFYGPGLQSLRLADRATIANMAPEYGATCGIFPVDQQTIDYLNFTGRKPDHVRIVEAYMKEQGMFATADSPDPVFSDTLELDLGAVVPSLAGPRRPQDRIKLSDMRTSFDTALEEMTAQRRGSASGDVGGTAVAAARAKVETVSSGQRFDLMDGAVVIAAITSCTNTSNPSVMVGAGLLAKKAVALGLKSKPWVKTSLAPGSKVVTDYLNHAGLTESLDALGFNLVGYGCTTCIGNSGPVPEEISEAIHKGGLVACSVLSGNRNFEGRINPDVRANYLASPPLVVAFALAGTVDIDMYNEPVGTGADGRSVFLKDIWPTTAEIEAVMTASVKPEMFQQQYAHVFEGDERWRALPAPKSALFEWSDDSTYIKNPPYFVDMPEQPYPVADIEGARVLASLGDSITTDHISPAGSIKTDSPAGSYLLEHKVQPKDFNSYGSRRGNHEVMMRGTFANIRLRNKLTPEIEGGMTKHMPTGEVMSIYDASMKYQAQGVALVILAGKEYGSGSSRDWAAKGPRLLGVRAVIAESYERIHRSNLVGMGVLPLQYAEGDSAASLGLTGEETFDIGGIAAVLDVKNAGDRTVVVRVNGGGSGTAKEFRALVRIDTPQEREYYRHGGILQYVLRQLKSRAASA